MGSAAARTPEDPLAQLPRDSSPMTPKPRDPLRMFGNQDTDAARHVFSDPTPSILPARGPLDAYAQDPVTSTLGRAVQPQPAGGLTPPPSNRPGSEPK
jgi:hypothetical protein